LKNKTPLDVTFLGTGTSSGIPMIACDCAVCRSTDKRDQRLRVSVLIKSGDHAFTIDIGPDFREQMLREKVKKLDATLITHAHKDHVGGLDEVRAFNFKSGAVFPVYAEAVAADQIMTQYDYIFKEVDYPGIPKIQMNMIHEQPFALFGLNIIPIRVMHYQLPVLGFRINDFTYITDANYIAPEELAKASGSKVLVINALRKEKHISHFTLDEAIAIATEIGAEKTYFIHMSHQLGKHEEIAQTLPPGIFLAYDGLQITV
jgi:phosphoribosyl 1,2-cyclic phosphate phosphodiesterase